MKKIEILEKQNELEKYFEIHTDYKNHMTICTDNDVLLSKEDVETVYGDYEFVYQSKNYFLSIKEGAMVPLIALKIDDIDIDVEIISYDSLFDNFVNSLIDTQNVSQIFYNFGIFGLAAHISRMFDGKEITSLNWLFMILGTLSIISGIGLKKNQKWSWWLAVSISFTICLMIIKRTIVDISSFDGWYIFFFIPPVILNVKSVLYKYKIEDISFLWRVLIPSGVSFVGLYSLIWR